MSKDNRYSRNGGQSWRDKRNYRRIYDENGNVVANIITVDGVDVEVTEEIFRAYSQMDRRERYLSEDVPADKVLSLEQMIEDEMQPAYVGAEVTPDVADTYQEFLDDREYLELLQRLRRFLSSLNDTDRALIDALYKKDMSVRAYARQIGVTEKAVRKRRTTILKKFKKFF